ncbi:MAG: gluconokinase, partial [Chloroflexota bacterium]|nr:gluconokinase [Chloroflexota bacterium]
MSPARVGPPFVLSLDVGTTSARAELYDRRGRAVKDVRASAPCPLETTPDGGAQMDPEALFEVTAGVLDEACREAGARLGNGAEVAGVGMGTFWHSFLGVDAAGRPTTPLFLWADNRSRDQMLVLRARLDERAVHARTGCPVHWSYWPAKLLWLAETHADAVRRTRRWLSFGEYFHLRLFGQATCSYSMASGTGLFDQNRRDWDPGVLRAVGVSTEQLSPLSDQDAAQCGLAGEYAERWPLLKDVPWFPAAGDGALSNVGSGCVTRERMALMIGTSGALRVAWPASETEIPWGAWCYRVDGRRFVMGGALTNGGNLYAWLRDTLKLPSIAETERRVARMEPDAHGLTVLPFLAGERAPGYAPDARAAILGMTLATRPIDVIRAGLEAIALRFALLHGIVSRVVPEAREVVATGGALLSSPARSQMVAD